MWSKSRLFRASQTLEFRVILHPSLRGAGYLLYIAGSEYRSIKPFYSGEAGEPSLGIGPDILMWPSESNTQVENHCLRGESTLLKRSTLAAQTPALSLALSLSS